jgi:UDP-N-acetylmuramoylalanine--D-glutamate ligase
VLLSELGRAELAILVAGREGLSVCRALRLRFPYKPLTLYTESAPAPELAASLDPRLDRLVEGPLDPDQLQRPDVAVRSHGISPYRTALDAARRQGVRFTTASSIWFAEHPAARTLCITGTKGKSTTAALVAHLLRSAGVRVQLAGNIGQPLLDCESQGVDWWVVELSSYQLADLEGRPSLGVILNLSDEHLDWHGSAARYRHDKLRLVELLEGHPLVACGTDAELRTVLASTRNVHWFDSAESWRVEESAIWLAGRKVLADAPASLPGRHNLLNLAAALTAVQLTGAASAEQVPALLACLEAFPGLPHRLQHLGRQGGLNWVNDSLATTPVATLAALDALAGEPVTLLVGGLDRGVDWGAAIARMRLRPPHAIIALPDSGPGLAERMGAAGLAPVAGIHLAADLAQAVRLARRITPAGGTVLLSPGAPSFPQFRDFAHRGSQFAQLAGVGDTAE